MSTSAKDSEAVAPDEETPEIEEGGSPGDMTVVSDEPQEMEDDEHDELEEATIVGSLVEEPVEDEGDDDESLDIEVEATDGGGAEDEALSALKAQVEELEQAKKDTYDRLLRTTADLDNTRKRAKRDVKDARIDERSRVLREILPVIDNLERASAHAEKSSDGSDSVKSILEGVNLVLRQFIQTMERMDVKPLEAVGKPFDPTVHEAVSQAPSSEYPPGTVIEVLQNGYMVGDRLLRPALSVVSIAAPEPAASSEDAADEDAAEASSDEDSGTDEASAEETSSEEPKAEASDSEESSADESKGEDA